MNEKMHIAEDDLALYAAGALSTEGMAQAEAHLRVCARCKEELRQNTLAMAAYAQTTPEAEPPQGAKDRFLARVAETAQGESSVPVRPVEPIEERKSGLWRRALFGEGRWAPALAGALVVLLIGVGLDDLGRKAEMAPLLKQAQRGAIDSAQLAQLMELLSSPQAKKVALRAGPVVAPPPEGRVVYAPRTGKLLLTASNLRPLPAGKVYELWILQAGGGKPLPAGTFAPDDAGYAAMILADMPAGAIVQGFGVTVENAGGSETPTLPIVLSGL